MLFSAAVRRKKVVLMSAAIVAEVRGIMLQKHVAQQPTTQDSDDCVTQESPVCEVA